jgi:DNA polymerase III delta prime subunit
MPDQVLSLSFRPQTLDDMVGVKHTVKMIRQHVSSRMPAAWCFIGDSGSGKTTIARILALSLQCTHQKVFGVPCEDCQKKRNQFDIIEINAAEASGVDETEHAIAGAYYNPKPPSKYRVYIFDEAQNLSKASQSALLKYFEDSPRSTIWIICTTEPGKILRTLRRRCLTYPLPSLSVKGVETLVQRAIAYAGEKKSSEPLAEALLEAGVSSPGFVVVAVEKYLAGEDPEKAAQVGLDSTLDTLRICKAVTKGDWETTRHALFAASPDDARAIRGSLGGYLKAIVLSSDGGSKAKVAVEGIRELVALSSIEDGLQLAGTVATLYRLCRHFNGSGR